MTTGPFGGGTTARAPLPRIIALGALIAAVLACYLPTPGDYWIHYDNPQMIRQDPRTRALTLEGPARVAAVKSLLTTPHHNLYQPLASLSWAIDHALFGWDRSGFHAHSLALHLAVVVALFFLALRLCGSVLAAFLAALLYAVHPVMVQSVYWTISRTSSLAAIWILLGCHLHLAYLKRGDRHYLLAFSTLAFAISLCAKTLPTVVLLPIILNLWLHRPVRGAIWFQSLPLAAAVGVLTLVNLELSVSALGDAPIVRPWQEVLWATPESLALTLANTLWPRDLALYYGYDLAGSLIGWRWGVIAAGTLGAAIGGVWLWRQGERGVLLSSIAFLALLAPQVAAIRYRDILTADRYAYVPLLFLALGTASALAFVWRDRVRKETLPGTASVALMLVAATALGIQTRRDSRLWADEEQLWQRVVSQTPAPLPYLALCKLYARENQPDAAVAACQRAHELALTDRYASGDAAYAFHLAAKARGAGEAWQSSTRADASATAASYFALASQSAQQAIDRWPERIDLRYELGRSQLEAGDARGAIATFDSLLAIRPGDEATITYLGVALFEAGDVERAREVLAANPAAGSVEPIRYATLARIYTRQGLLELAAAANLAWVEADPEDAAAHEAFLASLQTAAEADPPKKLDRLRERYQLRQTE